VYGQPTARAMFASARPSKPVEELGIRCSAGDVVAEIATSPTSSTLTGMSFTPGFDALGRR